MNDRDPIKSPSTRVFDVETQSVGLAFADACLLECGPDRVCLRFAHLPQFQHVQP